MNRQLHIAENDEGADIQRIVELAQGKIPLHAGNVDVVSHGNTPYMKSNGIPESERLHSQALQRTAHHVQRVVDRQTPYP